MKNILKAIGITAAILGSLIGVIVGVYFGMNWLAQQPVWFSLLVIGLMFFFYAAYCIWSLIDAELL